MRVAILHDYLNQFGGAERVLKVLLEIFPKADLYTLLYDKERTFGFFEKNIKKTSFLDVPFVRKNHRAFIPFMPFAAKFLRNKSENYDLVFSSTAGYGKGINIDAPYHISYCYTPLRYAWETDYLKNLSFSPWALKRFVAHPIANWLRGWDKNSSNRVNLFVTISNFIAEKIKSYYGRESELVYPPVDLEKFYPDTVNPKKEYFLMAGRLLYYKGFDLGIKAFNLLQKPLKIVGSGPEIIKLKKIANPNYIEFANYVSDDELRRLYSDASAFIFPQIEDFGLVAAEAQACGCPVLAFRGGGAKEIVEEGKTGIFFEKQSPESIVGAVRQFESKTFSRNYIAKTATRFSKQNFKDQIRQIVRENGFSV